MRVVSLLPSATEILCSIENGHPLLVGRSHECDFPRSVTHLPALTAQRTHAATSAAIDLQVRTAIHSNQSLYTLDAALLRTLQPDVILTQDLCDVCSIDLNTVRAIAESLEPQPQIVCLNPCLIEDVFDDVLRIGEAVGLREEAQRSMVALRGRYSEARECVNPYLDGREVVFLEWMDPLFVGGHWTPQLIKHAGGKHSLNAAGHASRMVEPDAVVQAQPEMIVICPCGFPIEQTQAEFGVLRSQAWWSDLPAVRTGRVYVVDGSAMFNRPGPRLVDAFCWLVATINGRQELIPPGFPAVCVDGHPSDPHERTS